MVVVGYLTKVGFCFIIEEGYNDYLKDNNRI
jgi:hypothetical protein